jgi:hypothetical protein
MNELKIEATLVDGLGTMPATFRWEDREKEAFVFASLDQASWANLGSPTKVTLIVQAES